MMTLLLSDWVREDGHVYAVEKSEDNALVLAANCYTNRVGNVTTAFTVLGKTSGIVRFGGESWAVNSCLVRELTMVTTDLFCGQHNIDHVDLLKIDVEGFEMDVLQGAVDLLKQRPKLALELHVDLLRDAGSSASEVWTFLESHEMIQDREITMLSRPN